jgi:two-component sensor histidine kinase
LQLTDILININLAIPLGMIINELVSNSLKYAFPENRSGEISITLQQSHADGSPSQADTPAFDLIIADNGVGMKETVDIENVKTLGVQLVHMLIRQVGGRIEKLPVSGTAFKISVGIAE